MMEIALIAAIDNNRAIGFANQMPWHLPDDLKFFKAQTQGGVVVMGRKTFESLGCRPLPNRRNIVLTRQADWQYEGIEVAHDWSALKLHLEAQAVKTLWVIGGAEIYALALSDASKLVLTHVDTRLAQADAYFPAWSVHGWISSELETHDNDERHAFAFRHVIYQPTAC
jgi:dihydrofolate reductase